MPKPKTALQVLNGHGSELNYRLINNAMPYLDAVVKETARLLIPSNGGFRRATQDLRAGQHVIPKGSCIWWSTYFSHALGICFYTHTLKAFSLMQLLSHYL